MALARLSPMHIVGSAPGREELRRRRTHGCCFCASEMQMSYWEMASRAETIETVHTKQAKHKKADSTIYAPHTHHARHT
eukprot:593225-Pleurochrysis_carterae.AAC.1